MHSISTSQWSASRSVQRNISGVKEKTETLLSRRDRYKNHAVGRGGRCACVTEGNDYRLAWEISESRGWKLIAELLEVGAQVDDEA